MKTLFMLLTFCLLPILVLSQSKTTIDQDRLKKEAGINKQIEEGHKIYLNGATPEITLTSQSLSDKTDIIEIKLVVSEEEINCKGYSIKLGMSKSQVSQSAKNMSVELSKKTSTYWLISYSPIFLKFKNEKLDSILLIDENFNF